MVKSGFEFTDFPIGRDWQLITKFFKSIFYHETQGGVVMAAFLLKKPNLFYTRLRTFLNLFY